MNIYLPACFRNPWYLPLISQTSEAEPANTELSYIAMRPSAQLAPVISSGCVLWLF